jgi:hypothetical protein
VCRDPVRVGQPGSLPQRLRDAIGQRYVADTDADHVVAHADADGHVADADGHADAHRHWLGQLDADPDGHERRHRRQRFRGGHRQRDAERYPVGHILVAAQVWRQALAQGAYR